MKRVLYIIAVIMAFNMNCYAINWQQIETPLNGRIAFLDKDSIVEYKNYYFYNIKFQNPGRSEFVIMTMQSSRFSPLSVRVKAYNEDEYKALNGDYQNITAVIKPSLEPVTFQSVVYSCYKLVDSIVKAKEVQSVILDDENIAE